MTSLRVFVARVLSIFRGARLDGRLDDEIASHIDMLAEENVRRGMPPDEARYAALRAFGGVTATKEAYRDGRGLPGLESFVGDVRYGLRSLAKAPVFAAVAILSLALGIGANTAVFSVVDAVMLRELPVHEPGRLVLFGHGRDAGLTNGIPNRSWDLFSYPFFHDLDQHADVFAAVGAVRSIPSEVHGTIGSAAGEAERIEAQLVSGTYFSTLGVNAELGRVLGPDDDRVAGGSAVAIVSHAWWERRLGSDPAAVGTTITIGRTPFTIVGVAPREFFGTTVGEAPDMWVPLAMEASLPPGWENRGDRTAQTLYLVGRLKDGVTVDQAESEVGALFQQEAREIARLRPSDTALSDAARARIDLTPAGLGISSLRREFSLPLKVLMAVVGLVLLVACANVANLLLARSTARRKEFATRVALGAGRTRLVRQLLTESALLGVLGGAAGTALAIWGGRVLVGMVSSGPEVIPVDVTPDARVLAFTVIVSLVSVLVFGTIPALRAGRVAPNAALRSVKSDRVAGGRNTLGKGLVVTQVAVSLVLLVGASLFVRTLVNIRGIDAGFDRRDVAVLRVDASTLGYAEDDKRLAAFMRNAEERTRAIPGVRGASFAMLGFEEGAWTTKAFTKGINPIAGDSPSIHNNVVGDDYFDVMGLRLLLGRPFGPQDTRDTPKVAVINETMARRFFGGDAPIGRRFGLGGPERSDDIEVVGVVQDSKVSSLTETPTPVAYYAYGQGSGALDNFLVACEGDPSAFVPQIRDALREAAPGLAVDGATTLSEQVDRSLTQENLVARLSAFFGLLALLLASIGLYGLLSYAVARRTNEIGVRMALGARGADVLGLVMRDASALVLGGVALGLAASLVGTRAVASLLYGLAPNDPTSLAAATLILIAVAAIAGWLPARRASRVDPLTALRED